MSGLLRNVSNISTLRTPAFQITPVFSGSGNAEGFVWQPYSEQKEQYTVFYEKQNENGELVDKNLRIISRLDIKGRNVIKGIRFECLRVMGLPLDMANNYYLQGADEIIYVDTVASLYDRSKLVEIVKQTSTKIHIPLIAAGGVRELKDIEDLLKNNCSESEIKIFNT